jgi:hypothetical protein
MSLKSGRSRDILTAPTFFCTALGVYTLWVLGPSASAAEYDAIADRT